jgi:hypothetical protein
VAISQYYVSPASGNDTTGDGSIGTPWATVQKALDTITRNATDGDQINVQAGTADVLSAALSLATYGTPTYDIPLIIRGYTSTANDGGIGELSGGGANVAIYNSATVPISLVDLKLGNTGTAAPITAGAGSLLLHCEVHTASNAPLIYGGPNYASIVANCYFHDLTGQSILRVGGGNNMAGLVYGNYLIGAPTTYGIYVNGFGGSVIGNVIIIQTDTSVIGIFAERSSAFVLGNTIYSAVANTQSGISLASVFCIACNNIIEGWSGAGGVGLGITSKQAVGAANAIYNCTTPVSEGGRVNFLPAANDTLGGAPFVDAGTGIGTSTVRLRA